MSKSKIANIGDQRQLLANANDYLIDASDFTIVLKAFLDSDNTKSDRGRGQTVCDHIDKLIEQAREIVVDV
ncbi:MAG: hypothetical protein K0U72_04890 [Gammaproteobacteria bacterium]|nr:hypothetical protein [Gammaproteobacteria bacterium]